ncbi:MAG: hypothetical protein U9M95_05205 [Candidatus Altiarchaeota archaeon]|nr:hypothetical protein [Candidatus Altiarchaeota archaeon]
MILVDTNIISTFMKIERLDLLFKVFNTPKLYLSSNVFQELKVDRDRGYAPAEELFCLINDHRIDIVIPSKKESLLTLKLPESFGSGELDSIAICKEREAVFLSNEKKVINYCKRKGITCFDLCDILAALWRYKLLRKNEIRELIKEIEERDNVFIPSKDIIFEE